VKRAVSLFAILTAAASVRGEGGRWFGTDLGRPVEIPTSIRSTRDLRSFAYEDGEKPRGIRVGDGTDDYVLIGSGEYCGTGAARTSGSMDGMGAFSARCSEIR